MQRVANGSQSAALPAPMAPSGTPGYFADISDGAAVATIVDPDWLNDLQEEVCNVISAAGITLNVATRNQLLAAIQSLIAAGSNALLTDHGTPNTYVLTPATAIEAYTDGYTVVWKAANANTGPSTINVSAVGAVSIVHRDGTNLQQGDIPASSVCRGVFIGGKCQLEDAIPTLATTALEGLIQLATGGQAVALAATNVAITPAALGALFGGSNVAGGVTGHLLLPINPSGVIVNLVVNFGVFSLGASDGASQTVSFDIAFPNGTPIGPPLISVANAAAQMIGYSNLTASQVTFEKGTAAGGDLNARSGAFIQFGI